MRYEVTIAGLSPLLMNRFPIETARVPGGKNAGTSSHRGSEGGPADQAAPRLYADEKGNLFIPGANVLACLVEAGKFLKSGRSKLTTMKSSLVPAGVAVEEARCGLGTKEWAVDSRRVVNPATGGGMICHRPMLAQWGLSFHLSVDADLFAGELVRQLVCLAGKRVVLGDFRPSRRGPFGRFELAEWKEVA